MNIQISPATRALDSFIQASVNELSSSARVEDPDGLLFLGNWHDAYPSILVRDPFLTDSAKIHLLYLMQEARRTPRGAIALPSVDQTSRELGHSKGTAIRDRLLLRVSRWISLCQRVRAPDTGRFRGNVYAIHGEPCSLADATYLDREYVKLLDDAAKDHYDPYVRRAGKAALASIDKDVASGRDPLGPSDPIDRRVEASNAIQTGRGAFFGMCLDESERECDTSPTPDEESASPPGSKFEPGADDPGSNFEPGTQPVEKHTISKFEPGDSSSSNKKTTTTSTAVVGSKFETPPTLQWPDGLDDNQRRLVQRVLGEELSPQHHQEVLDALDHKLHDKRDPLRSVVHYAVTLCRLVKTGGFHPVGPACQDPRDTLPTSDPQTSKRSKQLEAIKLRGEIRALKQLLEGATAESRQPLESQLESLQRQFNGLDLQSTESSGSPFDTYGPDSRSPRTAYSVSSSPQR